MESQIVALDENIHRLVIRIPPMLDLLLQGDLVHLQQVLDAIWHSFY